MAIKVTTEQIPILWDVIKFTLDHSAPVPFDRMETYYNKILFDLLAGKAQCWVALDEKRELKRLLITKITEDQISRAKSLVMIAIFSFQKRDITEWLSDLKHLKSFARNQGCQTISAWVMDYNEPAINQIEALGFETKARSYSLEV